MTERHIYAAEVYPFLPYIHHPDVTLRDPRQARLTVRISRG